MFLMQTLPSQLFAAQPFVYGSYAKLQRTVKSVIENFPDTSQSTFEVRVEWEKFLAKAPQSDDVNEYTRVFDLKCPLGDALLGRIASLSALETTPGAEVYCSKLINVESG
jgi:hypothetical protein